MKILGPKNIVFTLWYDNLFWCTNKCRFCNLSGRMVQKLDEDNEELYEFLKFHFTEIRLLKLMWQEPYREEDMKDTIKKLLELGFKTSMINLTSIGSSVYYDLMKEIGYLTLSFSWFNPKYYGFKSKEHPYKKNIVTLVNTYFHKIDKINWIIWKFNLDSIDTDLEIFFRSLEVKNVKIAFLLQKGVVYSKQDAILFTQKLTKMKGIFEQNWIEIFQKEYDFYNSSYNKVYDSYENTELTYAYSREVGKKWFRCTWELTGKHHLVSPEEYIQWSYANNCTKICAWKEFSENPSTSEVFYYKLMLYKLGQFETSFLK